MKVFDNDVHDFVEVDVSSGEVVEKEKVFVSFGYDSDKDLHAVDPFGYINLADAYVNHNVPTNIADEVANYNGIDDPDSMLGTPKDIFEAYRMNDAIQRVEKAKEGVSPSKGEN